MKRQAGLYMPGRLYLFERHIGFHSQMWGYTVNRIVGIDTLKVYSHTYRGGATGHSFSFCILTAHHQ